MNPTIPITLVLAFARLIIAIQLTRVGRRQRLSNLLWLAAFFYITLVGDVFLALSSYTHFTKPFYWAIGLGEVVMVLFIHKTFYQDRKSPVLIFMAIALAVLVTDVARSSAYFSPFNWLWLIGAGYQAYKRIAANRAVEDWVKARYKLVVVYSVLALAAPTRTILSIIALFVPAVAEVVNSTTFLTWASASVRTITTIGVVVQYLAWVMPERYRRWLNRNYQPPAQGAEPVLTEEELMRQLKV